MNLPVYFLDANIFMYAAGTAHIYKVPCTRILAEVETGRLRTAINTEIVQELLYRYSHTDKHFDVLETVKRYDPLDFVSTLGRDTQ
jgi:predicted nucleic acid-binding protein